METVRPLRNGILVLPLDDEDDPLREQSLIIVPDCAKHKPMRGKIVAVGPGARDWEQDGKVIPMDAQIGDVIAFGPHAALRNEVRVNGIRHLLLTEKDILGIVEEGSFKK